MTIGPTFGGILVVSGLVATLLGGWLGDKLRAAGFAGPTSWSAGGGLLALPPFVAMLFVPFPYAWALCSWPCSSCSSTPGRLIPSWRTSPGPQIRATAFAINILVIHALGDVISPPLIGLITDRADLGTALLIVSVVILVGRRAVEPGGPAPRRGDAAGDRGGTGGIGLT